MLKQIQQSSRSNGRRAVNVEVLLQGAEKLCAIYPVAGAEQRILSLRTRHSRVAESVQEYESKVMKQQIRLNHTNRGDELDDGMDAEGKDTLSVSVGKPSVMTEDDLRAEENEIRELEAKKKMLEERIAGMERDMGGLLR